ncbi:MAG: hypothetical protein ABSA63_04560 [Thermoplasmata archaeon]
MELHFAGPLSNLWHWLEDDHSHLDVRAANPSHPHLLPVLD